MEIYANNVITEDEVPSAKHKKKSSQEIIKLNASSKKGFGKNIRHNSNNNLLKFLAFGVAGAVMYPLVPTLIQAVTEKDMSGFKGLLFGVGTTSLLGLGIGKPEMALGSIAAMGTHILYAKETGPIENLTNTQIFRLNPNSVVYAQNNQNENQIVVA